MALKAEKRTVLLGFLLVLTLVATICTAMQNEPKQESDSQPDISVPVRHANKAHGTALATNKPDSQTVIPWEKLERAMTIEQAEDLFKPHSWYVPPPKPVVVAEPAPPPKPTAPPVPFKYMGKMEDSPQGTLIFLSANNKLYSVAKGEVIDHVWRLDAEDANSLRLTYVPLGLAQTLSKSAKPAAPSTPTQNDDKPGIPG